LLKQSPEALCGFCLVIRQHNAIDDGWCSEPDKPNCQCLLFDLHQSLDLSEVWFPLLLKINNNIYSYDCPENHMRFVSKIIGVVSGTW
jgi:hypothetical protein